MDEDIKFNNTCQLNQYFDNTFVSYVIKNHSSMINPYSYFGQKIYGLEVLV